MVPLWYCRSAMGRVPRVMAGGIVYHVLNRANNKARMFGRAGDFEAFERVLTEAKERFRIELFAYCVMPNHWHLVVRPRRDGEIAAFMHWLTITHAQRWRTYRDSVGHGHLYQGHYHSFPVQKDAHFLQLCRYVERNPLRAHLVERAEQWRWSSLWRRCYGSETARKLVDRWPVPMPQSYLRWVNQPEHSDELEAIRQAVRRGAPYGDAEWVQRTARAFGIESTIRPRGRPRT